MSINHNFFTLKKEHISMIKNLDSNPDKLSLIGETQTKLTPFLMEGDLDTVLGHLIVGKELTDEEKEIKRSNNESFLSRDNMDDLYELYKELPKALNIVLTSATFTPATYFTRHYENNWKIFSEE